MGLFGKSLSELAKEEVELRNKYVATHAGEEVEFIPDDLFESPRPVKNIRKNLLIIYISGRESRNESSISIRIIRKMY